MNRKQTTLAAELFEKFGKRIFFPGMRIGTQDPRGRLREGIDEDPWEWTRLGEGDERHGMPLEDVERAVPDLRDPATGFLLLKFAQEFFPIESVFFCGGDLVVTLESDDLLIYEDKFLGVAAARILLGKKSS